MTAIIQSSLFSWPTLAWAGRSLPCSGRGHIMQLVSIANRLTNTHFSTPLAGPDHETGPGAPFPMTSRHLVWGDEV